ncbi:MAG: thioredoxin family protein [Elusimicrobiota bacterium]
MKKIQILGMGCPKCKKLYETAEMAARELGIEYEMEKITDINKITEMGVMITPALAINGEVKLAGKLPTGEELKKILKDN